MCASPARPVTIPPGHSVSRRACIPCGVQFRLVGDTVVLEKGEDEGLSARQDGDGGFPYVLAGS